MHAAPREQSSADPPGWSALPRRRGGSPTPAGTTLDFDGRSVAAGVLARTALIFDGAHDGVTLTTSAALSITGQITMEAWVALMATDGIREHRRPRLHALT